MGSRKIFSVCESDLAAAARSRRRRPRTYRDMTPEGSSDDFEELQPARRRPRTGSHEVGSGAPTQPALPPELHRHLTDLYKCNICRELPITPPVIFSMCCGQILGCRACVDTVVATRNSCPLCREDGLGENSCVVRGGMDDFMNSIRPYLSGPEI